MTETPITDLIERGFKCKADADICWYAYRTLTGKKSYALKCICGLEKSIKPDKEGITEYVHDVDCCGYRARLVLDGFKEMNETKSERRERTRREEREKEKAEEGYAMSVSRS